MIWKKLMIGNKYFVGSPNSMHMWNKQKRKKKRERIKYHLKLVKKKLEKRQAHLLISQS